MRILFERAMGRASSTLSPGHRHFAAQTKNLIVEIELLEEEVTGREQQDLDLVHAVRFSSVEIAQQRRCSLFNVLTRLKRLQEM